MHCNENQFALNIHNVRVLIFGSTVQILWHYVHYDYIVVAVTLIHRTMSIYFIHSKMQVLYCIFYFQYI